MNGSDEEKKKEEENKIYKQDFGFKTNTRARFTSLARVAKDEPMNLVTAIGQILLWRVLNVEAIFRSSGSVLERTAVYIHTSHIPALRARERVKQQHTSPGGSSSCVCVCVFWFCVRGII